MFSAETHNVSIADQTLLQTDFEPTEKMSTYLLAFIVSDFGYINNMIDNVMVMYLIQQYQQLFYSSHV